MVLKRITGIPFQIGGEPHSGWLPPGAAIPLPTPIRNLVVDLEIQGNDTGGYLLICSSSDETYGWDTWHQTLAEAENTAADWFGVKPSQWESD
jgi:hypothetical protein